jgi:hypothetical protein
VGTPNLDGITARDRGHAVRGSIGERVSRCERVRERAVMNGDARPAMPGR